MINPLTCKCGKPADYREECRDCYEDRMRHEMRDAYDRDAGVMLKRMLAKERCQQSLYILHREGRE